MSSHVTYGKFGRAHGNKGEIRLWPFNADTDGLKPGVVVRCQTPDGPRDLTIRACRNTDKCLLVTLEGLRFRDQLDPLTNLEVLVPRDALPQTDDDEFYHADLEGLEVFVTGDGVRESIGRVSGFLDLPSAHDVMAVEGPRIDGRLLVMWRKDVVLSVSLTDGIEVADLSQWAPEDFELKPA